MRNQELAEQFGRRLDQLRIGRAKTAVELAAAAGLTPEFVRRILGGEHDVRVGTVLKLARALDVEPGELLKQPARMKVGDRLKSSPVILEKMFPDLKVAKESRG